MKINKCRVCESDVMTEVVRFPELIRITSDCRSYRNGGKLFICGNCGAVQKRADKKWLAEIGEIYANYSVYEQGGGEEQKSVDPRTGWLAKRSDIIASRLGATINLHAGDAILDVGCGNGATLSALSKRFSGCNLYGSELSDSSLGALASIRGFKELFTVPVQDIGRQFELICMVHSLEHFENPLDQLRQTLPIISEAGKIFIQVCNVRENPFDFLVADHLMHFSVDSLSSLLLNAGYEVINVQTDWVGKEISATARPARLNASQQTLDKASEVAKLSVANDAAERLADISWLVNFSSRIRESADAAKRRGLAFGVFGTSIAASWIASFMSDSIDFFVDEDESRIGKSFFGKEILAPQNIDSGSIVFIGLTPRVAQKIAVRLVQYGYETDYFGNKA